MVTGIKRSGLLVQGKGNNAEGEFPMQSDKSLAILCSELDQQFLGFVVGQR
jgi:hypothetical protein